MRKFAALVAGIGLSGLIYVGGSQFASAAGKPLCKGTPTLITIMRRHTEPLRGSAIRIHVAGSGPRRSTPACCRAFDGVERQAEARLHHASARRTAWQVPCFAANRWWRGLEEPRVFCGRPRRHTCRPHMCISTGSTTDALTPRVDPLSSSSDSSTRPVPNGVCRRSSTCDAGYFQTKVNEMRPTPPARAM